MQCDCKDWKENIEKVSSPVLFQAIHGLGGYDGKQFVYCPWCGKKLVDKQKEQKDE